MNRSVKFSWGIAILLLCITILIGYIAVPEAYPADKPEVSYFHEGWTQIYDSTGLPLKNIQDFHPVPDNTTLIFTHILPSINPGEAILLHSAHQEITAYVDDVCIHSFQIQDNLHFLETPGSTWNQIDLTSDMSYKTLRLELHSEVPKYTNYLSPIFLTHTSNVESARLTQIWPLIIFAIILGILTISAFLNGFIWKATNRKHYFIYLGKFYLTILLWILARLQVFELITHRPIVGYLLQMFFIRCIPIALYLLLRNRYDYFPRSTKVIGFLTLHNLYIPFLLQFLFHINLLDTLWLNNLVLLLNLGLYITVLFKKTMIFHKQRHYDVIYFLTFILLIGIILDIFRNSIFPKEVFPFGLFSIISCTLYTACAIMIFRSQDAKLAFEKDQLEVSYQKLQTASLMQQMKAHFIFNTLNTISALCKYDPKAANHAVTLFASYMRSYMYLINTCDNIPLEKELTLVRAYLSIEKIRFEEKFDYDLQIDFQDFSIPPLSIQPLVENAVVHGIHPLSRHGSIVIRTTYYNHIIQIVVQDNGVGFNTTILNDESGVALNNLQKRIQTMSNGSIDIQSTIGEGTTATISIPLQ